MCTALLLAREFRRTGCGAFLLLMCAYFYAALMAVAEALAFPGAVSASGLFGGWQARSGSAPLHRMPHHPRRVRAAGDAERAPAHTGDRRHPLHGLQHCSD